MPTLLNGFSAHKVKPVRDAIADSGFIYMKLPANITSKVQTLDVGINKAFKDHMSNFHVDFFESSKNNKRFDG